MKTRGRINTIFLLLLYLCFTCGCEKNAIVLKDNVSQNDQGKNPYYSIEFKNGEVCYKIFDISNKIIDAGIERVEPKIKVYNERYVLLVLQMGTGPSTRKGYVYDVEKGIRSKEYKFILDYCNGFIAYGDFENGVIIESVFGDFSKRFYFYQLIDPATDIPDIILETCFSEKGDSITITYVSSDYSLKEQVFLINEQDFT